MHQLQNNKELEKVYYYAPLPPPSSPEHPIRQDPWRRKVYKLDGSTLDFVNKDDVLSKAVMEGEEVEEELAIVKSGWKMIDPSVVVLEKEKGEESYSFPIAGADLENSRDSGSYGLLRISQQQQTRKPPPINPSKLTKKIMKPYKMQKKEAENFLREKRRLEKLRRQAIIEGRDIEMYMIPGSGAVEPRTQKEGVAMDREDNVYAKGRSLGDYWPSEDERKRDSAQKAGDRALREGRRRHREELVGHTCAWLQEMKRYLF